MRNALYDQPEFEECVRRGDTWTEIAKRYGVADSAVRTAAKRRGIAKGVKTLRTSVEEMKPLDAVEMLLGIIEAWDEDGHPVDALNLSPLQRRIAVALHDAAPHLVTRDRIWAILYGDRIASDDYPGEKTVDVHVCLARKRLGRGYIENVWGRGWRAGPKLLKLRAK